jgi:hypothetical protein
MKLNIQIATQNVLESLEFRKQEVASLVQTMKSNTVFLKDVLILQNRL